jgi:CTP:molybdopterin cytidylyltransferase MocA
MGRPKGLLPVAGVPLLRAHVDVFQAAGLPVTVVLGAAAEEHRGVLPPGVLVRVNERWAETEMLDSLMLALPPAAVALVTPVDCPPVKHETLARLLAVGCDAVPAFAGRPGHPVRLQPPHPVHLRLDLRLARARAVPVDDPDCTLNFNEPADWVAWAGGA